jgi:hypothetical protein
LLVGTHAIGQGGDHGATTGTYDQVFQCDGRSLIATSLRYSTTQNVSMPAHRTGQRWRGPLASADICWEQAAVDQPTTVPVKPIPLLGLIRVVL